MTKHKKTISLSFALDVEDDWPPFSVESLPFEVQKDGFRLIKPPLFVKELSVDDVIVTNENKEHPLNSWRHIVRSNRTTIWLLRLRETDEIDSVLSDLRKLGCNTVGYDSSGCYSIDVPEKVDIAAVDSILTRLDPKCVATAFPSMRHPE